MKSNEEIRQDLKDRNERIYRLRQEGLFFREIGSLFNLTPERIRHIVYKQQRLLLNRISLNGKRYVYSKDYKQVYNYCKENNIPWKFIRKMNRERSALYGWWYLRLWGIYK
jgi:hypothetical protein